MKRESSSRSWFWPVVLAIGALAFVASLLFKSDVTFEGLNWEDHRSYALVGFTVNNRSDVPAEMTLTLIAERSIDRRDGVMISEVGRKDLDLLVPPNRKTEVTEKISYFARSDGHLTVSIVPRS